MQKTDANFIGKPLPELGNIQVMSYLISTHHEFTRNVMDEISELIVCVAQEMPQPPDELTELSQFWTEYQTDMLQHLSDEENILFPWIDRMTQAGKMGKTVGAEYEGTIKHMVEEHAHHEGHMRRVKKLAEGLSAMGGYIPVLGQLADKLKQLDHDLHEHMEIETKILFPRILGSQA